MPAKSFLLGCRCVKSKSAFDNPENNVSNETEVSQNPLTEPSTTLAKQEKPFLTNRINYSSCKLVIHKIKISQKVSATW